ncbi:MAG: hypothetical protein OEL91_04960, partial [Burkholderiaceae bacterium]|nr:hypothetical protein [Burkholderiaceae bacterium]
TFGGAPYTLSLTKSGNGSGSVTSTPAGLSCTTSCSAAINSGTSVTLTATPATGSRFEGWSGACTGSGACTVSMTAARSVTATFSLQSYAITVSKTGPGAGTIVSSPSGVNCGSTCSSTRPYGSVLTLKPTPAKGSHFAGWSGACSGTGACTVTVSQARNVGATFARTPLPLSVTRTGTGIGSVSSSPGGIDCGAICKYSMPADTTVTLVPSAADGSYFAGWRGSCTGTGACTVTMSAARSVTAVFTRHNYVLSVSKSGNGSVTSSPAGISCGSACKKTLASNTVVSLTAKPAKGWAFTGWSGECSGTSTCTVSMTSARGVAAAFSPI